MRKILQNPAYIGNLALQRRTTISYKNHKAVLRPEEDWIVTENAHPAIISKELWYRVKEVEKSVSQGKKTRTGLVHPLSGFMYCADCGSKMKLEYYSLKKNGKKSGIVYTFNCGGHKRYGKSFCFSHYIKAADIEKLICDDVKKRAKFIIANEAEVKENFILKQTQFVRREQFDKQTELVNDKLRCKKLDSLIESAFEEKLEGKIPADLCVKLIEKYSAERQEFHFSFKIIKFFFWYFVKYARDDCRRVSYHYQNDYCNWAENKSFNLFAPIGSADTECSDYKRACESYYNYCNYRQRQIPALQSVFGFFKNGRVVTAKRTD